MVSELAFRAQTILREQRDLYAYWKARAGSRPMPLRTEMDPLSMAHLLPSLSLLDTDGSVTSLRFRLAGTRVHEIYGSEVTGRFFFDLNLGLKKAYWTDVYQKLLRDRTPMQGRLRRPYVDRDHLLLFWLRLPLATGKDGNVGTIIAYDAAVPSRLDRNVGFQSSDAA